MNNSIKSVFEITYHFQRKLSFGTYAFMNCNQTYSLFISSEPTKST